jgi:hypothetical protein
MNLDRIIKPLKFNENGVSIGANKYFVQKMIAIEGIRPACWEAISYLHDLEMARAVQVVGRYDNKAEAERACNEHNQLHILKNLLTEDGQKAITEFELL